MDKQLQEPGQVQLSCEGEGGRVGRVVKVVRGEGGEGGEGSEGREGGGGDPLVYVQWLDIVSIQWITYQLCVIITTNALYSENTV